MIPAVPKPIIPPAVQTVVAPATGTVEPTLDMLHLQIERDKLKYAFWQNIITPLTGAAVITGQIIFYILTHQTIDTKTGEIKAEAKAVAGEAKVAVVEAKKATEEVKIDLKNSSELRELQGQKLDRLIEHVKLSPTTQPPVPGRDTYTPPVYGKDT